MQASDLPRFSELLLPTIEALKHVGGSALRNEVISTVADLREFSDEQLEVRYENTGVPVLGDRVGWALSYLKKFGAVENSRRGVWAITDTGRRIESEEQVERHLQEYRAAQRALQRLAATDVGSDDIDPDPADGMDPDSPQWRGLLLQRLLELTPGAFERLTQRLLKEAGFRDVEVLGRSGDGGLDGVGVYRLSLVSFPIYFQCKRYRAQVPASAIRDFRGAMAGRGEKGLLVTTGTYTRGARTEASRDGAPPVELIDSSDLCDLLKEYELGVRTRILQIEDVDVEAEFFAQFEVG